MSCKKEWQEDSEALSIAMDIVDKYEEMFEGIDLTKVRFIRILAQKSAKACKVISVGFPVNIDTPYLYYLEIDDNHWQQMTEEQRNLTVFSGLYEIAPGGMDAESVNYGKKRKRDIEDYREVVNAAGGRYDWKDIGASSIHNILNSSGGFFSDKEKENLASLDEMKV